MHLVSIQAESSPYIPIDKEWAGFLKLRDKKFRYKYRKRQEALEDGSSRRITWYRNREDVPALLAAIFTIEARSWKAKEGVDIRRESDEGRYHERLLPFLADAGFLDANVLHEDDIPLAYSLCCKAGEWVGQLKTSFDCSYDHLSPGSIVIDASIRRAFESGASEFDFLGDAGSHKAAWTDQSREHVDLFLFSRHPRSRLLGALKALIASRRARASSARAAS
jgi:CelD/BcsL family acetyltransferase involved in cellulose biosynthesis